MRAQPSLVAKFGVCPFILAVSALLAPYSAAQTQNNSIPARIVQPIDESNRTVLTGNTY
jgi:hypothetical protein